MGDWERQILYASAHQATRIGKWPHRILLLVCLCVVGTGLSVTPLYADHDAISVVEDGRAVAAIVTSDDPSKVASYAAEELLHHVEMATGVSLPVLREGELDGRYPTRIFVGGTQAALEHGMDAAELDLEASILRALNGDLYVLGREDKEAGPLDEHNPYSGTLFGVYEVLERYVSARWLWPGTLGTFVPETDTIVIDDPGLDETIQPPLEQRRFRWDVLRRALRSYPNWETEDRKPIAFSKEGVRTYAEDLRVYLRRHRMGSRLEPAASHGRAGHTFSGWFERHGKENLEWFGMNEEGERGAASAPAWDRRDVPRHIPMCVSNEELHKHIIEEHWDGGTVLRVGEADTNTFCHCPECVAMDGPQDKSPSDGRYNIADRYAAFYQEIYDLAVERNPDVEVCGYIYMHYFPAPLTDIQLNENVYLDFVPWGGGNTVWFPMSDEQLEWLKEQWLGWYETGASLVYRPNYALAGYVMPQVNTWQRGEFFQFAYEHGLKVSCRSLRGQWASRGVKQYMLMRLTVDPHQSIEEIRNEYFGAFGPASEHVERYFDHWEDHVDQLREEGRFSSMWSDPRPASRLYPAEVLEEGHEILRAAMASVEDESQPDFVERIRFLQKGLEHAQLSAEMVDKVATGDPGARDALAELIEFRRAHEDLYISDYLGVASIERRRLGDEIDVLLEEMD